MNDAELVQIDTISYRAGQAAIMCVRREVFVDEQSVPADLERDGRDDHCIHVLALHSSKPVGTGRIDCEGGGKVGRVAVVREYRRRGVGTQLMAALEQAAREHGLRSIWFHAQESAIPFYEKLGYASEGEFFMEAGIPHRTMRKSL